MKQKHINLSNTREKLPNSTMKDELDKGLLGEVKLDDDLSHLRKTNVNLNQGD